MTMHGPDRKCSGPLLRTNIRWPALQTVRTTGLPAYIHVGTDKRQQPGLGSGSPVHHSHESCRQDKAGTH